MKIATISPTFFPLIGGAEICIHNVLHRLATMGHDVCLYLHRSLYAKNKTKYSYHIRPMSFGPLKMVNKHPLLGKILTSSWLKKEQEKEKYDVGHSDFAFPYGYYLTALKGKVPIILTCHGADIQKEPSVNYGIRLNPTIEKAVRKTVNSFDKVTAVSQSVYKEYKELGVKDENIIVIPNGTDHNCRTAKSSG